MIIYYIKHLFFSIYKVMAVSIFNISHHTKILSIYASLDAKYGREVLISKNTFIKSNVQIGNYSYVNENSRIENCVIGNYCSISDLVSICPAEHRICDVLTHPILGNKKTKRVEIGNDVLISHNATILEGVRIGDGAIIGAGAVVTRNVEPYTIVGGVPAKFIRKRFSNLQEEKIRKYKIYDLSSEELLNLRHESKI